MNLYEIQFKHYSESDSKSGTIGYLLKENDNQVLDWFNSDPILNEFQIYGWDGHDLDEILEIYDDYAIIDEETKRKRLIRLCGEINDDNIELDGLYYGVTHYGWKLIKENIDSNEVIADFNKYSLPLYSDSI